jgi:DNA-binding MarR family transcriptional regulator
MLQDLVADDGITAAQWFFLRVLWDEDGLTQAELSDRVGLTTATTVVALNTLAKKRLVERRRHQSDSRKFVIKLTSRGRRMEQKMRACGNQVNDYAAAGIPKEMLDSTKAVLQQMRVNLLKRSSRLPKID